MFSVFVLTLAGLVNRFTELIRAAILNRWSEVDSDILAIALLIVSAFIGCVGAWVAFLMLPDVFASDPLFSRFPPAAAVITAGILSSLPAEWLHAALDLLYSLRDHLLNPDGQDSAQIVYDKSGKRKRSSWR